MKGMTIAPNGELLSAREKLVAMVLADSHQDKAKHFTYPSVDSIAAESLCDRRSCQRYLDALERKGVIRRLRPANQGAGMTTFYFFPALDVIPEGWQDAALFFGQRAAEGRQKGGKRVAGTQLALIERAQERKQEPEQKPIPPKPPSAAAPGGEPVEALERAVDQVCSALAIANRRKRRLLRDVVALEAEKGDAPATVALRMIEAWNVQAARSAELRVKLGLARFFGEGYWKNQWRWHWDEEQRRRNAEARMGSR